jgi:cytochrome c
MKLIKLSIALAGGFLLLGLAIPGTAETKGDPEKGKEVFEQCGVCHEAESDEKKMGPALKGLFKKEKLASGKEVTEENIGAIIDEGGNGMPGYEEILTPEERADLMAYLRTL